jgi:hypothetical protein
MSFLFRNNKGEFINNKSGGFLTIPQSIEQETVNYIERVNADGGMVVNIQYVDKVFKLLKRNNLLSNLLYYTSPSMGIKIDGNNNVSKLYSLASNTDIIQPTLSLQPVYESNSLNGKPYIFYNGNKYYTPLTLPSTPSVVSIFQVAKQIRCFGLLERQLQIPMTFGIIHRIHLV